MAKDFNAINIRECENEKGREAVNNAQAGLDKKFMSFKYLIKNN
ncbi:hypothetical protein [Agarilytica rhodophyticola]|nr:hypothetical protein [Agarilytica rhodophyticola]